MIELSEVTKRVQNKLGGKGAYQVTEWLVKMVIDEYEDNKPVLYRQTKCNCGTQAFRDSTGGCPVHGAKQFL
jgi:hypothetical protein